MWTNVDKKAHTPLNLIETLFLDLDFLTNFGTLKINMINSFY